MKYLLLCDDCEDELETSGTEGNKEEIRTFLKAHENHRPKVLPQVRG